MSLFAENTADWEQSTDFEQRIDACYIFLYTGIRKVMTVLRPSEPFTERMQSVKHLPTTSVARNLFYLFYA